MSLEKVNTDILIVGGGFAGASTAFHLSQSFSGSILIIEKEKIPGSHASGRNASLVLQSTLDPDIRRVLALSRRAYTEHEQSVGFDQRGSLLLGSREHLSQLQDPELVPTEYRSPDEVRAQIPVLDGHRFEAALSTPTDGVMDISALLQFYLAGARERGVDLRLDCSLLEVQGSGPYHLETTCGVIEARYLVNAAGAWAADVARMAGASEIPLVAFKRHLFILGEIEQIEPTWPFVWDQDENFYFRPESGGLLFSICDEEKTTRLEPTVSPDISQSLAEFVWLQLPALQEATKQKVWSCFRTKAPDASFVIGWDPAAQAFFWVAGLGGHGMGASWEVGRLAAQRFMNPRSSQEDPFAPGRFGERVAGQPVDQLSRR